MAAELEQESVRLEAMARNYELAHIDIARKASVLKAFEKAWSSGQGHPE